MTLEMTYRMEGEGAAYLLESVDLDLVGEEVLGLVGEVDIKEDDNLDGRTVG